MPDARSFLTALGRAIRSMTGAGRATSATDATRAPASYGGGEDPGREGPNATVELDPARVRGVRFAYTPDRDGEPDPGEVVWTWVPYEENDGRGKDRPVVIVAAGGAGEFLAVQLTSKGRDGDRDLIPLGSGPWDGEGRPSWARVDRLFRVRAGGMRREAASLDVVRYERVTAALRARYRWD
ncbi:MULTISPECIES: type II toxin-antitoxin system PemK/MazF family toxin [unclassified Agromyces]|uniref:type II toxin-antitoxin system PemK/MazF family toxin n=1 Tax=unclassified Agromyces TaxID=2639701 RepID=UPI0030154494